MIPQDSREVGPLPGAARALLDYGLVGCRVVSFLEDRIPEGLAEELESSGTLWGACRIIKRLGLKNLLWVVSLLDAEIKPGSLSGLL